MDPKPIIPTEGVSIGQLVSNTDIDPIDPSTGQPITYIKYGKGDMDSDDQIDGCPKPRNVHYTPPLQTPVVK